MAEQQDRHAEWKRLEDALVGIKPNDQITVGALVDQTGLLPETIESVLNALTKAELFERRDGHVFVRRHLLEDTLMPGYGAPMPFGFSARGAPPSRLPPW